MRRAGDCTREGNSPPSAGYASGDARLLFGASGITQRNPRVRRRNSTNLWRTRGRDSAGHSAWRAYCEYTDKFDPREYLKPARAAMQAICKARYRAFGCEGQASKITPIPLEKMAERYRSGELAQRVNYSISSQF